jgi:hypothetical protein
VFLRGLVSMLIRLGYDIQFEIPSPVAMVALLSVHPSRAGDLRLSLRPAHQNCLGRVYGADGRLPRFSASRDLCVVKIDFHLNLTEF